ncbi:MAG: aminoacetone oxidase family FAD-binding enzyme [Campylobacterota bacterium]|nr:aminoacetone oxidase family FAD-binding enzyme [Campylobacterota bacterium]
MIYDIAIIGAGASGLMAASRLKDKKVCLIDHNKKIGEKIKISGGSKCNITNKYLSADKYLGNEKFVAKTLKRFDQNDLLKFLNKNGVFPKVDEKIVKGTYFCNSSSDVISMFKKLISHVHMKLETKVLDVEYEDIFIIKTDKQIIKAKKLIVASGGLSYSSLGASGVAFDIAKKFGHNIVKTQPALVGFTVQKDQFWFKELSGLSIDVRIKVEDKTIEGKMLFTHKGCSGPAILTTSLYWKKGQISLDFLPFKESYLPKRLRTVLKNNDIDMHNYKMAPAGNFGYTKAEVTKGGIDTEEISENFESLYQKDLYFIGENLDVTGELGGYNFQWAFSSAVNCVEQI